MTARKHGSRFFFSILQRVWVVSFLHSSVFLICKTDKWIIHLQKFRSLLKLLAKFHLLIWCPAKLQNLNWSMDWRLSLLLLLCYTIPPTIISQLCKDASPTRLHSLFSFLKCIFSMLVSSSRLVQTYRKAIHSITSGLNLEMHCLSCDAPSKASRPLFLESKMHLFPLTF